MDLDKSVYIPADASPRDINGGKMTVALFSDCMMNGSLAEMSLSSGQINPALRPLREISWIEFCVLVCSK